MKKINKAVPQHIVLFPDGNRRWARAKGIDSLRGHKAGYDKIVEFCEWCEKRGIRVITAFGFSTENWNRTEREVSYLMKLLEKGLLANFAKYTKDAKIQNHKVRIRVIGQRDRLPKSLQTAIQKVEDGTKDNKEVYLNLAVSYGGRWDIVQAAKRAMKEGIAPEALTEENFAEFLCLADLPAPDLVIRAGGEKRFSNFVLWQAAYAELYFSPKYWPDFTEKDLDKAIEEYANRQRRFGH